MECRKNQALILTRNISFEELLDAVEADQFELVLTGSRRKELEAIAGNTSKKDKRINIRISNRGLTANQSRKRTQQ